MVRFLISILFLSLFGGIVSAQENLPFPERALALLESEGHAAFRESYAQAFYRIAPLVTDESRWTVFKAWVTSYRRIQGVARESYSPSQHAISYIFNEVNTVNRARLVSKLLWELRDHTDVPNGEDILYRYLSVINSTQNWNQERALYTLIGAGIPITAGNKELVKSFISAVQGEASADVANLIAEQGSFHGLHLWTQIARLSEQPGNEERIADIRRRIDTGETATLNHLVSLTFDLFRTNTDAKWKEIITALGQLDGRNVKNIFDPRQRPISRKHEFLRVLHEGLDQYRRISTPPEDERRIQQAVAAQEGFPQDVINRMLASNQSSAIARGHVLRIVRAQIPQIAESLQNYFSSPQSALEPAYFQRFFELLVNTYFRRLPEDLNLQILKGFVEEPRPELTNSDKFKIIIHNAGPNLQKLMQTLARERNLNSDFASTLREIEANVKSPPMQEIETYLRQRFPHLFQPPTNLNLLGTKPLGAGTMAITYKASYNGQNGEAKTVALRILRPGVQELLAKETQILRDGVHEIENAPELRGTMFENYRLMLEPILRNTENELHIDNTIAAQNRAAAVYRRSTRGNSAVNRIDVIVVPRIFTDLDNSGELMAQEFIEGQSFENFMWEHPEERSRTVEDFAKIWIREALFAASGFHHADPHQGNLLIRKTADGQVRVVLLDYGLSSVIDPQMRRSLIMLNHALETANTRTAARLTGDLAANFDEYLHTNRGVRLVERALSLGKNDVTSYLEYLLESGIELKAEIVNLKRGLMLLDQLLQNADSREDIIRLFGNVGRDIITSDVRTRLLTFSFVRETPLRNRDILRLMLNPPEQSPQQQLRPRVPVCREVLVH